MTGPAGSAGLTVAYVLGSTAGGTGRHVAMLAAGCVRAGCDIRAFGPADVAPLLADGPAGATIGFEPVQIGVRPRPVSDLAAVRRLRRLLAAANPHVVHAHGLRAGALAALALYPVRRGSRPRGRPPSLLVTVHNAAPTAAWAAASYAVLERIVARRADAVLCVSADLITRMRERGAREVELAVVPAGPWPADPAEQDQVVPAELAGLAAGDGPVVLTVARLARQKGLDTLLAAAATARWRARRPEPRLVIAGTGPLERTLTALALSLRVPATFAGWRSDVPELLAASAVFVLPSHWEGQPLVLQEALRAGRPIVATDVGGVRALTAGAALLVPPGDPAALADAVLRVLDDGDLAARLATAAVARAARLPTEADAVAAALDRYRRLAQATAPAGQAGASSRR